MRRTICLITALCIVLGSFSFCFASATSWDTSDQANLRAIKNLLDSGGGIYNMISTISSTTNTISNNLNTIKGYLFESGHGIAYWVQAISTWMSPIYNSITSIPTDLISIKEALWKPLDNGSQQAYLSIIEKSISNITGSNSADAKANSHWSLLDSWNGFYSFRKLNVDGSSQNTTANWYNGSPIGNIAVLARNLNDATVIGFTYLLQGFGDSQTYTDWTDLSSDTFTPNTLTNGLYAWLSKIQNPVARLSYVLASDERIEAQEAAAANEEAVVDNFIDSNGTGSVSASDIGSMAGASDSVKDNFNTGYSSSNVWDIFNSDHYSWFSQECADSLDTTVFNTRNLKSGSGYNTPLLDSYYEQILSLGGDN